MINKRLIFIAATFICCIAIIIAMRCKTPTNIYIDENSSYFNDYEVLDNTVYINCKLNIYNPYNYTASIKLYADDSEDVSIGLLKQSVLKGVDESNNDIITLKPGINLLDISFIGEFNNNNQKTDRNLPEIKIEELD